MPLLFGAGGGSGFSSSDKKQDIQIGYPASIWSGRRGSNSLPPPWQGGALPDELRPHNIIHCNRRSPFCQELSKRFLQKGSRNFAGGRGLRRSGAALFSPKSLSFRCENTTLHGKRFDRSGRLCYTTRRKGRVVVEIAELVNLHAWCSPHFFPWSRFPSGAISSDKAKATSYRIRAISPVFMPVILPDSDRDSTRCTLKSERPSESSP